MQNRNHFLLDKSFKCQFSVLSENLRKEKEAEIQEMKNQFEREYEELQNRQQEISAAAVELERKKFTEEQNKALQLQAKQLRAKFKCDMDGLRARFKMMQTAGALDRSPSASESELSLEVSEDIIIRLRYKLRFKFRDKALIDVYLTDFISTGS